MAFCTYTEVQLESGTACGTATTADITSLIARSDAEIADILTQKGVTAPASATQLKTASIYLTIAKIKRRQAHELSRTNSASVPGLSYSVSVETEIAALEEKAHSAILQYVSAVNGTGIRVSRVRGRCH
ncbi:MAG: hypothetical protein WC379_16870 [Methanoregula sp.]|jgi:hypothetical protein